MKRPQIINEEIVIEKMVPGGQALATLSSGQKIFLWNALPGEVVKTAEITKAKSKFVEAIALDFFRTTPERIQSRDQCYLATSPWQILDYPAELSLKRQLLLEVLAQHQVQLDHLTVNLPITDGLDFFYRNKMEYALFFDHQTQKIHPAFHARGSHRKFSITNSSLERPEIFQAAQEIIQQLNTSGREAREFQSLLLRCDQYGKISGGPIENHRPHPKFLPLSDSLLGKTYTYSPNGFFQINLPMYQLALNFIKPHIETDQVLDFYAGVGSIGLSVAHDKELTLVEVNADAYQELVANTQSLANSSSVRPVLASAEASLDFISHQATLIVDPPRAGCHPQLINRILQVLPLKIIYMSCNPATLARDLKLLTNYKKYHISSLSAFNFFPRTPHLEVVAILELSKTL